MGFCASTTGPGSTPRVWSRRPQRDFRQTAGNAYRLLSGFLDSVSPAIDEVMP